MQASVDKSKCIGCGLCAEVCPEVFEMSAENIAVVKTNPVPPERLDSCREAASSCPVEAIAVA
jgi:ferredoxin